MNLFQGANASATFLILSAIVAGISQAISKTQEDPLIYLRNNLSILYLGAFIVIFRIKTLLDDHKHFGEPPQATNAFRYLGFILAVISWILWAIAAYLIANTIRSSEMMATSLLISIGWIVIHLMEILFDRERRKIEAVVSLMREKWILINAAYVMCLFGHIGFFSPLVKAGSQPALIILLGMLLLDVISSRSFSGIIKS